MPRVYINGKKIPIAEATWECLCDPATLVTNEDPEAEWPSDIHQAALDAPRKIRELLDTDDTNTMSDLKWELFQIGFYAALWAVFMLVAILVVVLLASFFGI